MMESELHHLLDRLLTGNLSEKDRLQLISLLEDESFSSSFAQILDTQLINKNFALDIDLPETERRFLSQVLLKSGIADPSPQEKSVVSIRPAHRVHFIRRWWWAAAILIIGTTFAVVVSSDQQPTSSGTRDLAVASSEIAPGGERAILTLADGRTIALDSAANGQLANQGGVKIIKLANGQISYDLRGLSSRDVMWNTMSTPKGGQYQVTLPDGTKVWLNASSAITFPTAFIADQRQVKIQGEVYFEVTKNKQKPFVVEVDGKTSVEVLGTSFNVNSYADEGLVKTTLLDGSVKITTTDQSVVLKPGQQAKVRDNQTAITVAANVDVEQALDWKNGIFNFNGADLPTVMRQLERWYDIKVQYKGSVSNIVFKGKMYRNVNFSDVLDILKKMGVRYQLEGKNLIVL